MVDYSDIQKIEIMKPGKWNGIEFTPAILRDAAASYDPHLLKAPIVLDHKEEGQAYGHILDLEFVDSKSDKEDFSLMATIGFFPEGAFMLNSGRWSERSVFIDDRYPTPGIPYIRHLSLLGAANPAVSGMKPVDEEPAPETMPEEKPAPEIEELPEAFQLKLQEININGYFVWDLTDKFVRYRVRPPSRFQNGEDGTANTFRTVWLSEKEGINSVQGKLRKAYVPKGKDADSMIVQSILFVKEKWELAKAKTWIRDHEGKLNNSGIYLSHAVFDNGIILDRSVEKTMPEEIINPDPVTPATPPPHAEDTTAQLHIEPGSLESMKAENAKLRADNLKLIESHNQNERKLNAQLKLTNQQMRENTINARLDRLLAGSYITPAYIEEGLKQIFDILPDESTVEVHGKKIKASDALERLIELNGKLKIREEYGSKFAVPTEENEDLAKLASLGATNLDLAVKAEELMQADSKLSYGDALVRAEKLLKGGA